MQVIFKMKCLTSIKTIFLFICNFSIIWSSDDFHKPLKEKLVPKTSQTVYAPTLISDNSTEIDNPIQPAPNRRLNNLSEASKAALGRYLRSQEIEIKDSNLNELVQMVFSTEGGLGFPRYDGGLLISFRPPANLENDYFDVIDVLNKIKNLRIRIDCNPRAISNDVGNGVDLVSRDLERSIVSHAQFIASTVARFQSLEILDISNCNMGSKEINDVINSISSNHLSRIDISNNNLDGECILNARKELKRAEIITSILLPEESFSSTTPKTLFYNLFGLACYLPALIYEVKDESLNAAIACTVFSAGLWVLPTICFFKSREELSKSFMKKPLDSLINNTSPISFGSWASSTMQCGYCISPALALDFTATVFSWLYYATNKASNRNVALMLIITSMALKGISPFCCAPCAGSQTMQAASRNLLTQDS